jgi:hypothetical protein
MKTYRLSTYDPGDDIDEPWGWNRRVCGLSLWQLRDAIREWRAMGYDDEMSILVEREDRH